MGVIASVIVMACVMMADRAPEILCSTSLYPFISQLDLSMSWHDYGLKKIRLAHSKNEQILHEFKTYEK